VTGCYPVQVIHRTGTRPDGMQSRRRRVDNGAAEGSRRLTVGCRGWVTGIKVSGVDIRAGV
jgi:hypothetical protein